MKIFNYNLNLLIDFAKDQKNGITKELIGSNKDVDKELAKIKANGAFLEHSLALLSNVRPVLGESGYSIEATLAAMPEAYKIEGQTVTKQDMVSVVKLFFYYAFGYYCKKTQTTANINSATPIFLYAQRLYNSVPYNTWDRSDKYLPTFLGKELSKITTIEFPDIEESEYEQAKVTSVTDTAGDVHNFNSYKCNKTGIPELDVLPRFFRHMYLKTWIFDNPRSSMITELKDWDTKITEPTITPLEDKRVLDNLPF